MIRTGSAPPSPPARSPRRPPSLFRLRESDDYASRVKPGDLLSGQYRFREALDAYRSAGKIRADDPMLYIRLGGARLTLRHFGEAKKAYDQSLSLGGKAPSAAYPMGVWHYLLGNYREAADCFAKVLPCGDELKIAVLYWNALCCMRGRTAADEALRQAERDRTDLNAVVAAYGIAVYLEYCGKTEDAHNAKQSLLRRESVWPCISYLAAWNDMKMNAV